MIRRSRVEAIVDDEVVDEPETPVDLPEAKSGPRVVKGTFCGTTSDFRAYVSCSCDKDGTVYYTGYIEERWQDYDSWHNAKEIKSNRDCSIVEERLNTVLDAIATTIDTFYV